MHASLPSHSLRFLPLLLLAAGCGDGQPPADETVAPGQSIQAALARMPMAAERYIIEVKPGIYHETLSVDRPGVELRGVVQGSGPLDRPVLDGLNSDGKSMLKDAVIVSGAHFSMHGFLVRNYSGNGVTTMKTHHIELRDIWADTTGRYGLYPVESQDIVIDGCSATHISDSGIYVGQSKNATVRNSKAFGNVTGIEIENTVSAVVENNEVYDNAGGILVFVLPNNPSKVGQFCIVQGNRVHDNNHVNFGDPMAIVSKVPSGIGVAIMAADDSVVQGNDITGNNSVGVAIINLNLLADTKDIDVDPNPDDNRVMNNRYQGNGQHPDKALADAGFKSGGDLLWDGTGSNDCLDEPQGADLNQVGIPLPRCK